MHILDRRTYFALIRTAKIPFKKARNNKVIQGRTAFIKNLSSFSLSFFFWFSMEIFGIAKKNKRKELDSTIVTPNLPRRSSVTSEKNSVPPAMKSYVSRSSSISNDEGRMCK